MRLTGDQIVRAAAAAAVLVVAVVAASHARQSRPLLHRPRPVFQNASQLVKGNLVQVAGVPVGKIPEHRPDRPTARPTCG